MPEVMDRMNISDHVAADLLVTAFEGGSNYWYMINNTTEPEVKAKPWGDDYTPSYIYIPFSVGGSMEIGDLEDEEAVYTLNREAIERGKQLLRTDERFKHHYADVLNDNMDADTGDVFLQLCCIGDVVYG